MQGASQTSNRSLQYCPQSIRAGGDKRRTRVRGRSQQHAQVGVPGEGAFDSLMGNRRATVNGIL